MNDCIRVRRPWPALGLLAIFALAPVVEAQPLAPPPAATAASSSAPPAATAQPAAPPGAPRAQPNPHGANPHGGGNPQEMPLPQDGAEPAPDLERGTILISLRDAGEQPFPNTPFELAVLHQSVARGDSKERLKGVTDARGLATFSGLEFGSGHVYRVLAKNGEASFDTGDFNLNDKFGVRAHLHIYEWTADINDAGILGKCNISVTLKEDVLVLEYQVSYLNRSPTAWVAEHSFPMPVGFKAFNTPDGGSPKVSASDANVSIKGTVPPGETPLAFKFQIPMETDGSQTLELPLPPNMAAVGIALEASQKMNLTLAGYPKAERKTDQLGKSFLVTKTQITSEDYLKAKFLSPPSATISGLPSRPWASYLAVFLSLGAVITGLGYLIVRKRTGLTNEAREDLKEARSSLLIEFALLEKAFKRGDIGPKTYERLRVAMLDALAGILDRLEPQPQLASGPSKTAAQPDEAADEDDDEQQDQAPSFEKLTRDTEGDGDVQSVVRPRRAKRRADRPR